MIILSNYNSTFKFSHWEEEVFEPSYNIFSAILAPHLEPYIINMNIDLVSTHILPSAQTFSLGEDMFLRTQMMDDLDETHDASIIADFEACKNQQIERRKQQESMAIVETVSDEELLEYRHPSDDPKGQIIVRAAIRPQSCIGKLIAKGKQVIQAVPTGQKSPVVLQTFRYSKEEGDIILKDQTESIEHIAMPPILQGYKSYRMDERMKTEASTIGFIRVTFSHEQVQETKQLLDCFIPCAFLDEKTPVVGFGPSVVVEFQPFLSKLEHMLESVVLTTAEIALLVIDDGEIMFVYEYLKVSQEAGEAKIGGMERYWSHLTYQDPPRQGNGTIARHSKIYHNKVQLAPKALESDFYRTKWSMADITKCLDTIDNLKSEGKSGGAGFGAPANEGTSPGGKVQFDFRHVFVPPISHRSGWDAGKMAEGIQMNPDWWGFIEYVKITTLSETGMGIISELAMQKYIGPSRKYDFKEFPYECIEEFISHLVMKGYDGEATWKDICKVHNNGISMVPQPAEGYSSLVKSFVYPKKQIEHLMNAGKGEGVDFWTRHSRVGNNSSIHTSHKYTYFEYVFHDNEPKPGKDNSGSNFEDNGFSERSSKPKKLSKAVSTYVSRPCTMAFLISSECIDIDRSKNAESRPSLHVAPNGVEWSKLIPRDVMWSANSDDYKNPETLRREHRDLEGAAEAFNADLDSEMDFGTMSD